MTHVTTCRFIKYEYNENENIIRFNVETEYGYKYSRNLWYPCENINRYHIIYTDLQECTYWKVKFHVDNGQIISMQGIRDFSCILQ